MEKRKHRFNIVDAVVLILVAAALVTLIFKIASKSSGVKTRITFVMKTGMMKDELSGGVAEGDSVYDEETGRKIGTVVACESKPAQHEGTSFAGTRVTSEVVGYRTLYVTCVADVTLEDGEYKSDGVAISSGKNYSLMFPSLYCSEAECITVTENAGD